MHEGDKPGAVEGITVSQAGTITCATPGAIDFFRLVAFRGAVHLESLGMRHSAGSMTARAKKFYGIKGSRAKVLAWLEAEIERRREEGR